MKTGDTVIILIGNYKGATGVIVEQVQTNAFTVNCKGTNLLLFRNELRTV